MLCAYFPARDDPDFLTVRFGAEGRFAVDLSALGVLFAVEDFLAVVLLDEGDARFALDVLDVEDVRLAVLCFEDAARLGEERLALVFLDEPDLRDAAPASGTFFPSLRASLKPIAIACARLLTVLPERPDFSLPCFWACSASWTFSEAALLYFLPDLEVAMPRASGKLWTHQSVRARRASAPNRCGATMGRTGS